MANNRKRTRGRRFNYQGVMEKVSTPFGLITVIKKGTARKVYQRRMPDGHTENSRENFGRY